MSGGAVATRRNSIALDLPSMASVAGPFYRSWHWGHGGRGGRWRRRGHDREVATRTTIHNHAATLTDGTAGRVWGIQSWSSLENWSNVFGPLYCERAETGQQSFQMRGVAFKEG